MSTILEVETKFKVNNLPELRRKIKSISKFVKKEIKKDDYYALKKNGYPKKAFRVRSNGKNYVINFKDWKRHLYSDDIVVKEENEFTLRNKEQLSSFLALMEDLGFRKWIGKVKQNESYAYKKDNRLIIELNKVKRLGYYVELEYLCNEKQVKQAKKVIRQALIDLGVKKSQINNTGYTKMLFKHKH
jgi:adenylate cyclase, class 2